MKGRKPAKGEITFHVVWRELPSESLMIEAGVSTLVDHLERRAKQRRSEPAAHVTGFGTHKPKIRSNPGLGKHVSPANEQLPVVVAPSEGAE